MPMAMSSLTSMGHCDPDLKAAAHEQLDKLWHVGNLWTEPAVRLCEELVTASGFAERAFLCNSGARQTKLQLSSPASRYLKRDRRSDARS